MKPKNRIQELRWERNITVEQLSRRCGISSSTISRIENGNEDPRQSTMIIIAKYGFRLPTQEVFFFD